jgi:hypothetical protein
MRAVTKAPSIAVNIFERDIITKINGGARPRAAGLRGSAEAGRLRANAARLAAQEDKMKKIMRFEPLSVMRISAITYALLGFVEGALFSVVFSLVPMAAPNARPVPHAFGLLFGGFSIVAFPVLFGVVGAVFGGLGAVIYNVSARFVGGIEVDVQ